MGLRKKGRLLEGTRITKTMRAWPLMVVRMQINAQNASKTVGAEVSVVPRAAPATAKPSYGSKEGRPRVR